MQMSQIKKEFALRGGMGKANSRKYNADLKGCQGAQHFRFDTGLECFKYSIFVVADIAKAKDVNKKHLDGLVVNRGGVGQSF